MADLERLVPALRRAGEALGKLAAPGAAAGMPAVLLQQPLFTGIWWELASGLSVGTPLIFDIGVFLAVMGSIRSVLLALEED